MRTRPSFISIPDFKCLEEKYSGKKLDNIIKKIENNYPVQYAIGNVDFLNTKILVNKHVLIPRFETELFVEKIIEYLGDNGFDKPSILDLCTGSGCIAIALKKNVSGSIIYGVDIDNSALNVAKKNAKLNDVSIKFLRKDVLTNYKYDRKFSVLISNPPYVKNDEYVSENTKFEPSIALYPGDDDIVFYKKILDNASKILYPNNIIAFEIGSTQAESICTYAKKNFKKSHIDVVKDYNGYDRFIFIVNKI